MITTEECRELAELLSIHWHGDQNNDGRCDSCQAHNFIDPNFLDARVVLREARKRDDWQEFAMFAFKIKADVWDLMLDETGQLAKKLLKWLGKEEKK